MSKRKKRNSSPNTPQAPAEQTNQMVEQAAEEVVEETAALAEPVADAVEEAAEEVGFKPVGATPLTPPVRRVRAVRRDMSPARPGSNRSAAPKKDPTTEPAYVRNRLANPTRFPTEADLRAEYGYVIKDLRSMGVLAGVLIVALFVLERIL